MPKMSGMELFTLLKTQGKQIPFYVMTGGPTMNTKILLENGIKDILFKQLDLLRIATIFK
jgi:DNA-binding NtrC family response regulator